MNGFRRLTVTLLTLSLYGCAPSDMFGGKKQNPASKKEILCATPQTTLKLTSYNPDNDAYIVKIKSGISILALSHLSKLSAKPLENLGGPYYRIKGLKGEVESVAQLSEVPEVEFIEPDYKVFSTAISGDPKSDLQWAHQKIGSSEAWKISTGDRNTVVAIVDSGVDIRHRDLADNIWTNPREVINGRDDDGNGFIDDIHGWDFVSNDSDPSPDEKAHHGTHVAGTVGARGDNGIGIKGHAPEVQIMPLRFMDDNGTGYTSSAIQAIYYAIRNGAKVINNSWGGYSYSRALYDAISASERAGILFVAAAGNQGNNNDSRSFYPASFSNSNILSVALTDKRDQLVSWSNYGNSRVDIAAPGYNILSTAPGNRYIYLSGTSMAAPLVSGVAATMFALNPKISPQQVIATLKQSSLKLPTLISKVSSGGRINAAAALQAIANGQIAEPLPDSKPDPRDTSDNSADYSNCDE